MPSDTGPREYGAELRPMLLLSPSHALIPLPFLLLPQTHSTHSHPLPTPPFHSEAHPGIHPERLTRETGTEGYLCCTSHIFLNETRGQFLFKVDINRKSVERRSCGPRTLNQVYIWEIYPPLGKISADVISGKL